LNEELTAYEHNPASVALEHAHNVAFHTGLGGHRLSWTGKFPTAHMIPGYAKSVYQKGNIAVVASGAPQAELEKWTSQFFADVPQGNGVSSPVSQYFGGENRYYGTCGNALVIAFPGSQGGPSFKPEFSVLAYLLGGQAGTKWNVGTSLLSQAVGPIAGVKAVAKHSAYSDAGLLSVTITGPQEQLTKAGQEVVKAINSLANVKAEDVKKAIAQAKFDVLAGAEDRSTGLELVGQSVIASGKAPQVDETVKALEGVTVNAVQKVSSPDFFCMPCDTEKELQAANALLQGKATYTAVGELHFLPFASDIGLRV
jgi:ubiquinol-cytochrome c reductase core subunit 2